MHAPRLSAFRLPALLCAAALALMGCETRTTIEAPPAVLEQKFKLGHLAVVTRNAQQSPISRDGSPEEWKTALDKAIKDRFSRLDGDTFYHLGVHLDGYSLAPAGVPLIASPKSVLIMSVSLLADAPGAPLLTPAPEQITVFESLSGGSLIGSGYTSSAEEQMANLSFNAAIAIEDWLARNAWLIDPSIPRPTPVEPVSTR